MKNGEVYKTVQERCCEFNKFCANNDCGKCQLGEMGMTVHESAYAWLDLDVIGKSDELHRLRAENRRLRAALKPVLKLEDNYDGHWPFASLAVDAVKEAQRIYKEVE